MGFLISDIGVKIPGSGVAKSVGASPWKFRLKWTVKMTVVPYLNFTNRKWTVKDTYEPDSKYTVKSYAAYDMQPLTVDRASSLLLLKWPPTFDLSDESSVINWTWTKRRAKWINIPWPSILLRMLTSSFETIHMPMKPHIKWSSTFSLVHFHNLKSFNSFVA